MTYELGNFPMAILRNLLKSTKHGFLKMAILDLKTSVWGLNRSEFDQKHKYNITKPNQAKTAAQVEKNIYF